jgi:hypothetical protein
MSDDGDTVGMYVNKVRDTTRRYVRDLLSENTKLRALVASLESENGQLKDERLRVHERLLAAREELDRIKGEESALQRKLSNIEAEHHRFSSEFEALEQQNSDLSNLYVASYRLHATLDRKEVLAIIQEIVINLIGCEELAVFEVTPDGGALTLAASFGIDASRFQRVTLGAGAIGRAARAGELYLAEHKVKTGAQSFPEESDLTTCIPLKLDGRVTGAIALFRLLPQKARLEALDKELFELLATHAATALYCAGLHATPTRLS